LRKRAGPLETSKIFLILPFLQASLSAYRLTSALKKQVIPPLAGIGAIGHLSNSLPHPHLAKTMVEVEMKRGLVVGKDLGLEGPETKLL
jgi:hypothetical protein